MHNSCEIKSVRNTEEGNEDLETYMLQNQILRDMILEKDNENLKISKELDSLKTELDNKRSQEVVSFMLTFFNFSFKKESFRSFKGHNVS